MTTQNQTPQLCDIETDAVALDGLTLALRIVVTDYLSDRQLPKCNAIDALADALCDKSTALVYSIEDCPQVDLAAGSGSISLIKYK